MENMYYKLLENVHYGLKDPTTTGTTTLCRGNYQYFHYGCDHITDAVKIILKYNKMIKYFPYFKRANYVFNCRAGVAVIVHYKHCAVGL